MPPAVPIGLSFLTIGSAWISHSGLTDRLERIDPIFLRINLLILFTIAFLPFPTRLVSQALQDTAGEQVAVTLYGLTLLAIRILGSTLDAYCRREHLYTEQVHSDELQRSRRKLLPALIAYVIAILLGLVVPDAAVALYFGIAVYLVVPFRDIARLARRS